MRIRTDGYYRTKSEPWVDWHAGHKFEGILYSVFLFLNESQVITYVTDKPVLDMDKLRNGEVSHYRIEEDNLGIWSLSGKFSDHYFFYVILSSEYIVSEKGSVFYFVPFA